MSIGKLFNFRQVVIVISFLASSCYIIESFHTKSSYFYRNKVISPHIRVSQNNILNSNHYSRYSRSKLNDAVLQEDVRKNSSDDERRSLRAVLDQLTNFFPLWVLSFSIIGFFKPFLFQWFLPYVSPALTLTMLSMGMTLTMNDFKRVVKSWQYIFLGFIAQYTIMPFSAAAISKLFHLSPSLSTGLILVGCAPGGTASNLVTLIAKADLALSILMTTASTIAAVFMTPFLVTLLAGNYVTVKSIDLVYSTLSVVLLPVLFGLIANTKYPTACSEISKYTPFLSVLFVSTICGSISSSNKGIVLGVPSLNLVGAVLLLHSVGFAFGYVMAKLLGAGEERSRTISIETGMQNSALAVVLSKHFPNPQLCALPGAISATCHSLLGSLLAVIWRRISESDEKKKKNITNDNNNKLIV